MAISRRSASDADRYAFGRSDHGISRVVSKADHCGTEDRPHKPLEQIALNADTDGYIEFADDLGRFNQVCVPRDVW